MKHPQCVSHLWRRILPGGELVCICSRRSCEAHIKARCSVAPGVHGFRGLLVANGQLFQGFYTAVVNRRRQGGTGIILIQGTIPVRTAAMAFHLKCKGETGARKQNAEHMSS